MSDTSPDYERGKKEGRVDALLEEHTARLNKINGSVERFSKSHDNLAKSVSVGFEKIASEIRTMQEEARLREERVKVAAQTLAAENERRRFAEAAQRTEHEAKMAEPVRAWGIRANKATVLLGCITVALTIVSIYLATR
jgi:septal ring factor EnvC (AmiA/AmiB activator)